MWNRLGQGGEYERERKKETVSAHVETIYNDINRSALRDNTGSIMIRKSINWRVLSGLFVSTTDVAYAGQAAVARAETMPCAVLLDCATVNGVTSASGQRVAP